MKVLGLTGGIGSGKSIVADIFKTLGIAVYNSDQKANGLYFKPDIKKQVEELLGKETYISPTELNKKHISAKIFSDSILLEKVNAIIHPAVGKDFDDFKRAHKTAKYIVKESALLIEAGLLSKVDKLLVITSALALRTERIKKRDRLDEAAIEKIISKQLPEAEKTKHADWVIENNEERLLIPQVIEIHKALNK